MLGKKCEVEIDHDRLSGPKKYREAELDRFLREASGKATGMLPAGIGVFIYRNGEIKPKAGKVEYMVAATMHVRKVDILIYSLLLRIPFVGKLVRGPRVSFLLEGPEDRRALYDKASV